MCSILRVNKLLTYVRDGQRSQKNDSQVFGQHRRQPCESRFAPNEQKRYCELVTRVRRKIKTADDCYASHIYVLSARTHNDTHNSEYSGAPDKLKPQVKLTEFAIRLDEWNPF